MAKLYLTAEERSTIESVLEYGFGRSSEPQWLVVRIAFAKSLQMPNKPGAEFAQLRSESGGSELHEAQVTGHGGSGLEDFRDAFAALLSVREGRDYVSNQEALDDAISRYVRRGIHEISSSWMPKLDFFEYLLQELYFDQDFVEDQGQALEGSRLWARLEQVLGQLGIGSTLIDRLDGPRLSRFILTLYTLEDLKRFQAGLGKISFSIGAEGISLAISQFITKRQVHLDVPRGTSSWQMISWSQLKDDLNTKSVNDMALPICIGTDVLGSSMIVDLADAPHIFIAGMAGSGKSMCLHSMILSLIHRREVWPELLLIDSSGVVFGDYSGLECLRNGEAIQDMHEAEAFLRSLSTEMELRHLTLAEYGVRNIAEVCKLGVSMRRVVVFVDELADLFEISRNSETWLALIAEESRRVGIHLVLATARPDVAIFSESLRSNILSRIAFTVGKSSESRVIIDEPGAEDLKMRGDMLIRLAGRDTVRAHGCFVNPGDIARELRS